MSSVLASVQSAWSKNWPEVHCALTGGLPGFVMVPRPARTVPGLVVFCYHTVRAQRFERDLRFLRDNGYRTITADDAVGMLAEGAPPQEKVVVLTFDDGAVNLHRVAFPLLQQYGFRAVAFVSPRFHENVVASLRDDRPCTWEELKQMDRAGVIDVQSHTYEHRFAPRWPQPYPLTGIHEQYIATRRSCAMSFADDVRLAREMLEQRLGKSVMHLAFPNYQSTLATRREALEIGYRGLWHGVHPGRPMNRPGDSPAEIVRISGEFVRRLPGRGRQPLMSILFQRYRTAARQRLAPSSQQLNQAHAALERA